MTILGLIFGIFYTSPSLYFAQKFYFQNPTKNIDTAIVLGASVINNTEPSQILKNRLDKALELYNKGEVKKILVSGDNLEKYYNEPEVMKNYLLKNGVTPETILTDSAGLRTNDTCWRAKNIFKINQAYIVTQNFHMPRALFLCNEFGIKSYKAVAKNSGLQSTYLGWMREIPASWLALNDVKKNTATYTQNFENKQNILE